ncbi:MAG: 16S rRNA (guanine(527)-N(7))-methyltransferase RsmG [Myxococcales bacterium]|nr:16S rRNA (guanine(527)-N(7))-methyltransferase RsmG [Myxococcota bacterium]MDW8280647.1 16S rRNA (guanine(527)-N(7))-methyltransferase RsmG [Myxococcales bacterium]
MNVERLRAGAARLGRTLDASTLDRFATYFRLLSLWGHRINLTAHRDEHAVVTHHFLDSLVVVDTLPPLEPGRSVVDVGSGAGFPGMVIALLRPDLRVTLVERVQKKAAFLLTVSRELGVSVAVRACDVSKVEGPYDVAVSRAAFRPALWIPVGERLVAAGGWVFVMLGGRSPLPPPPAGFIEEVNKTYDVGGGARRILRWRRSPF